MLKKSAAEGGAANVMVVSSLTGKYPQHMIGVYAMTKAALDNMVIFLGRELMNENIRVNGIAPGLIKTEFSGPLWQSGSKVNPKALGMPDQIASIVATICSKGDGAFANSEVYQIHGGFSKL